ncbi:ecotropic viral integration site [Kappamyces sp. JEL0680]|nr:ecotropic viral integration site [Kappamyces sp. JEL0680]
MERAKGASAEKLLPHAPRSSSLSHSMREAGASTKVGSGGSPEPAVAWSLASITQSLYRKAVETSPPIWSDSDEEGSDEIDTEDFSTLPSPTFLDTSMTIDEKEMKTLLIRLNRANALLANNPRTVMAANGSIHAQPQTLTSLTSFYYNHPANGKETNDPSLVEFWNQFLDHDPQAQLKKMPHLLIAKARSSPIPDWLRGNVWTKLCCASGQTIAATYRTLLERSSPSEKIIERFVSPANARDIGRTFPHVALFQSEEGQQKLFRILKAGTWLAAHNQMSEEDTFAVLLQLMGKVPAEKASFHIDLPMSPTHVRKFGIRSMFTPDMSGLHLALFQHAVLVQKIMPELAAHLDSCNITSTMYASQWFLTLFSYSVPLPLVFRIFDLIFSEGVMVVLMRVSLALLHRNQARLLSMSDLETVLNCLKGASLLEAYCGDFDAVIQESAALSYIVSFQTLEDLKVRYVEEERKCAIALTKRDLEIRQGQIQELTEQVRGLHTSNSSLSYTAENLQKKLDQALFEKRRLEDEAAQLRARLSQVGVEDHEQIDTMENVTAR